MEARGEDGGKGRQFSDNALMLRTTNLPTGVLFHSDILMPLVYHLGSRPANSQLSQAEVGRHNN